ncbi:MAG: VOC family protein [Myxococcota bacterium]|nr:VOC family protein [Myxococcota bacterium]
MAEPNALPAPARERGRIAPVKLAHVVMRTSRYRKMVDWYKEVLEAESTYDNPMITFLTYDEEHHRIAIANMPALLPRPRFMAGVEHVAFTYPTLGDLLATFRRLAGVGIEPYWCINHGGTTSMYYADPDGNQVELQVDNFERAEDLNEFLYGPAFQTNQIGVDFDPLDLSRRHEAGESHAQLVRWIEIAPRGPETIPTAHLGRLHGLLVRIASRRRTRR